MRRVRFLLALAVALALGACVTQQQTYVTDPAPARQADMNRGLFSSASRTVPDAPPPASARPDREPPPSSEARGLFNSSPSALRTYAAAAPAAPLQRPYVLRYTPPRPAAPQYAAPQYPTPPYDYAAVPAAASPGTPPYTLDSGDRLRIVVFGQEGISNTYIVDAGGNVTLPLIGTVPARGFTTQRLAQAITARLKQGYVREPHVTVEVEVNRPFFILGEVTNPGQYPYVADMTVEKAVAIAGGFAPRAYKRDVEISRSAGGQQFKGNVPLNYPIRPGDTLLVKERWF